MRDIRARLAALFGAPETMTQDEIEYRVRVLEDKVEGNRVALEQHEKVRHRTAPKVDELDR